LHLNYRLEQKAWHAAGSGGSKLLLETQGIAEMHFLDFQISDYRSNCFAKWGNACFYCLNECPKQPRSH
jgi:hypothetical protein